MTIASTTCSSYMIGIPNNSNNNNNNNNNSNIVGDATKMVGVIIPRGRSSSSLPTSTSTTSFLSLGSGIWEEKEEEEEVHFDEKKTKTKKKKITIVITEDYKNNNTNQQNQKIDSKVMTASTAAATAPASSTTTATTATTKVSSEVVKEAPINHNKKKNDHSHQNDQKLLELAEKAFEDHKVLEAYRILQQMKDNNDCNHRVLFQSYHHHIYQVGYECQKKVSDLSSIYPEEDDNNNDNGGSSSGWMKQGESHGKYNTNIYYKYSEDNNNNADDNNNNKNSGQIICRLETPIECNLLIPLLSVLNETNLYTSWIPQFKKAGLGLQVAKQLDVINKVNQILYIYGLCPWPFAPRELYLQTIAIDETTNSNPTTTTTISESTNNNNNTNNNYFIAITIGNYHKNNEVKNDCDQGITNVLPEDIQLQRSKKTVRCDFDGTFLFRPCPLNHPLLINNDNKNKNKSGIKDNISTTTSCTSENSNNNHDDDHSNNNNEDEPMLLVSYKFSVNPHMFGVPKSFINFVVLHAIGVVWNIFLKIANKVKNGSSPLHQHAINTKPEIYYDIEQRAKYMIQRLQQVNEQEELTKKNK